MGGRVQKPPLKKFTFTEGCYESNCNAGDLSSIPGSQRSSGEGNNNPLQGSCLENPMDRGAWPLRTLHAVSHFILS